MKLGDDEIAVRCLKCRATPISLSLAQVVKAVVPRLKAAVVYELSSRGPFFDFLRRRAAQVIGSEYVEGARLGTLVNGVRVEDVQSLTFPAASFDICTATEVFEHVADDIRGFQEILRVLRPRGTLLFTVPLSLDRETSERARVVNGKVTHSLPAEYHFDPANAAKPILCYRNYGSDIVGRLTHAGFARAEIIPVDETRWFGYARAVVVAQKQADAA